MTHRTHIFCALLVAFLGLATPSWLNAQPVTNIRSIDGLGNNLANPQWGAAGTMLPRASETPYSTGAFYPDDGSGATFFGGPGSNTLAPNPRDISNTLYDARGKDYPSERGLSNMSWQWGQFLDHDISLSNTSDSPSEFAPILMSPSDPMAPLIPFQRSVFAEGTGTSASNPRQQINSITSYIDASNVYGSDPVRANELRDLGNGGRLKTSAGDMLPYNTAGLPNAGGSDPSLFLAGDVRANEQAGLTSMHTLFVREHNRLAGLLADQNPGWSDDDLYQTARRIVGAELQSITYREFLPALLGAKNTRSLSPFLYDYDPSINAGINNEFANAAYRYGHSMLPDEMEMARMPGAKADTLSMKDAFFNPAFLGSDGTGDTKHLDQLLLGLSTTVAQEIDTKVSDGVRNFLFGDPGSGGMDLAAINIQRGRDHGLPSYNEMRLAYGLDAVSSFAEITRDRSVQKKLKQLYGTVHDIDSWVGGLAEDHIRGGSVGELMYTVMYDQFMNLRDGDSQFFTGDGQLMNNPAIESVIDITGIRLSDIITLNTEIRDLPDNVFFVEDNPVRSIFAGIGNVFDHLGDFFDGFGSGGSSGFGMPNIFRVPEPSAGLLALVGSVVLLKRRRLLR